jgi:hypothetical protein
MEVASDKSNEILASLVSSLGWDAIGKTSVTNILIRLLIKRSERLATAVFALMNPIDELLHKEIGFVFLVMLRYLSLYDALRPQLPAIKNISTQAATILVSKLEAPFKPIIHRDE